MHGHADAQSHQVHIGGEAAASQRERGQANVTVCLPAGPVRLSRPQPQRERFDLHQNPRQHLRAWRYAISFETDHLSAGAAEISDSFSVFTRQITIESTNAPDFLWGSSAEQETSAIFDGRFASLHVFGLNDREED